jgi:hypothetical protein
MDIVMAWYGLAAAIIAGVLYVDGMRAERAS